MKNFKVEQVNGSTGRERRSVKVTENRVEFIRQELRYGFRTNPEYSSDWVRVTEA